MKEQGFTLIELLAVIVILAIIALIATPIVLNIISNTKENAQLRSAEMYLDAVEQSVMREKMEDTTFKPNECEIKDKKLYCNESTEELKVEVDGAKPDSGSITFTEGKITQIELKYENGKIIAMNNDGDLEYVEGSGGSDEVVLFYDDFEDGLVDRWTGVKGTSTPITLEIVDDVEQGKVLSVPRITTMHPRYVTSTPVSIPTDITSINVSVKIRNDSETAEGTFYVRIIEYNEDESLSVTTNIYEGGIVIPAMEWVETSSVFTRTEGYSKVAVQIHTNRLTRLAFSVDDIKITYEN